MLITGCSSGIGAHAAARLVQCGFLTFATVRKEADIAALKQRCGNSNMLCPLILDVTKEEQIKSAVETVQKRLAQDNRQLLGLINNAGYASLAARSPHGRARVWCGAPASESSARSHFEAARPSLAHSAPTAAVDARVVCSYVNQSPVEMASMEMFREQYEANVFGTVAVTQAFLPLIRQYSTSASSSHTGRIVFLSSVGGRFGVAGGGPYTSTKSAIEAIADSLRMELQHWRIQVSLVEPGAIRTDWFQKAEDNAAKRGHEVRAALPAGGFPAGQDVLDFYVAADAKRVAGINAVPRESPAVASDCIEAALLDSQPLARYTAGWSSMCVHLFTNVPHQVPDFALGRLFR